MDTQSFKEIVREAKKANAKQDLQNPPLRHEMTLAEIARSIRGCNTRIITAGGPDLEKIERCFRGQTLVLTSYAHGGEWPLVRYGCIQSGAMDSVWRFLDDLTISLS